QGSQSKQVGMIFWYSFSTLVFAHKSAEENLLSNCQSFSKLASMLTVQQIQLISREDYVDYHSCLLFPRAISNLNFESPRLKPYQSPEEYANALRRGSKNGGVSAIIDEIPYIKVFLANTLLFVLSLICSNGCSLSYVNLLVFPKGSPLVQDISSAIVRLREEGKLQMIENALSNSESSFSNQDSTSNPSSLNLDSFGGLFLVTGISSTSALLIWLYQ
ncbi:glutamate receptor 1.4-like, partial [Durio zibethinus]|uniref:Glutamate receptor 1.4-like n=1 Tax=Durio zibethinus TaxID=66656 RepID=A0A6P6AXR3_DURZI